MATKQEYIEALERMEQSYYNFDGCMSAMNKFKEDIDLLTGLVNEHFEEKKESNLEHYKKEIKSADYEFALVNGKPTMCKWTLCDQCFFKDRTLCAKNRIKWMLRPFKRKYKLTQFEYDLLQGYLKGFFSGYEFKNITTLNRMKEKGYFKGIDDNELIGEILAKCEVV